MLAAHLVGRKPWLVGLHKELKTRGWLLLPHPSSPFQGLPTSQH